MRSLLAALTIALAVPLGAPGQVNPLDQERGRVIQRQHQLGEEIRASYNATDYERVLDLCDELETLDPTSGRVRYYRSRAEEMIRRIESGEVIARPRHERLSSPRDGEASDTGSQASGEAVVAEESVAAVEIPPAPPTDVASELPPPTPIEQVAPRAEELPPEPLGPESLALPAPVAQAPPPAEAPAMITLPLVGEVDRFMGGLIAGIAVLIAVATLMLVRLRRRVKSYSTALDVEAPPSWEPVDEPAVLDAESEGPEIDASAALDDAFARAAAADAATDEEFPAAAPQSASLDTALATLAQPWSSIEEAIQAIREEICKPLEPEPEPQPDEREIPLSIDGMAPSRGVEMFALTSHGEMKPVSPEAGEGEESPEQPALTEKEEPATEPVETPGGEEEPEIIDADEAFFADAEEPEAQEPSSLDLSSEPETKPLAVDLDGAPPEPPEPEESAEPESAPLTTEDLLEEELALSPKETTGPPLSLDDLLGPSGGKESKPGGVVAGGFREKAEERQAAAAEPAPPAPESPVPFDPDELEETIALPLARELPRDTGSGNTTLVLEPEEMERVLEEAPKAEPLTTTDSDGEEQVFMQYYHQGLEASEAQDWPRAVQMFQQALAIRPESHDALQRLHSAQEAEAESDQGLGPGFTPGL